MPGDLNDRLRYNNWANATLYGELKAKGSPESALRAFQHVLETELTWSSRILGLGNPKLPLWAPGPAAERDEWLLPAREQMERVAAGESANGFTRTFQYRTYADQPFEDAVAEVLEHTLIHSAQYRGEAAGLSNVAGIQMPDLDYIFWKRMGSPAAESAG
jgi:uncharacterized damage-inducible protein DinB